MSKYHPLFSFLGLVDGYAPIIFPLQYRFYYRSNKFVFLILPRALQRGTHRLRITLENPK